MRKTPNPKLFLLMAIAAFVFGGGACFFAFNNLNSAKSDLQKMQADAKDAKALGRDLETSKAALEASAVKLQHLEAGVQDYAYIPTLLSELEKLGKASGISVVGVRPMPKPVTAKKDSDGGIPKRKTYDELDIEVKGRGSYRAVMNFVQALGKFPKIVAARTVDLTPKNEPGQTATSLDVTIDLRAYVFPTPQPESKTDQAKTAMAPGVNHEG